MYFFFFFFFFSSRRRHTRLTCDWSSDVCSSDLVEQDAWRDDHCKETPEPEQHRVARRASERSEATATTAKHRKLPCDHDDDESGKLEIAHRRVGLRLAAKPAVHVRAVVVARKAACDAQHDRRDAEQHCRRESNPEQAFGSQRPNAEMKQNPRGRCAQSNAEPSKITRLAEMRLQ